MSEGLRMYRDLASWWPLLSPAADYAEEAADILAMLRTAADAPPRTLLELGSGGGSLASHLKGEFQLTLTDISPEMLDVSRAVNPECEHLAGDMRTLDLGRQFDLVLIHDAIMYCTDPASVRAALSTAARHCRAGGATLILPDYVKESFEPQTQHGGQDGADGRGLRFLEWSYDPDPADDTFETFYVFALREPDGHTYVEHERHVEGLFSRASWLTWLGEAGFASTSRIDPWDRDVFVARRLAIER